MKIKNIIILLLAVLMVVGFLFVRNRKYYALVRHGKFICEDVGLWDKCENHIDEQEKSIFVRYTLPTDVTSRLDAKIFYFKLAEIQCSSCPNHKYELANLLIIKNAKSDCLLLTKLRSDMKSMSIQDVDDKSLKMSICR